MNQNHEQHDSNPYNVDYSVPEYYVKYNQDHPEQQTVYQQTNLNDNFKNVNQQPLIDSVDSLEYTDSISNLTPRMIENENNETDNNHCEKSTCIKCFCLLEIILDIIGLIIYFVS